jgi:hypothetical protein
MAQVQAHPWFKQGLPAGAALMNATILAEASARPLALRQSPEALAALVQVRVDGVAATGGQQAQHHVCAGFLREPYRRE